MRVLHTSDWHLGQKFIGRDRSDECRLALDWLLQTIVQEHIDLLVVSGDIFDITTPSNAAQALYYRFLSGLLNSSCRHIVVVGGNHDSPGLLEAPKQLLQALNIHLVGGQTETPEEQLLVLKDANGQPEAVVAAVPFLRDGGYRSSIAEESAYARIDRIKNALRQHYQQMGELAQPWKNKNIPILATGHLYAYGAETHKDQANIYLGDTQNIRSSDFPAVFSYVALGHIHRPQAIGGESHIRYSGSLIPLSFSETADDKSVVCLEYKQETIQEIKIIPIPLFRRLKQVRGSLDEVLESLQRFSAKEDRLLTPWLEVVVESDLPIPGLHQQIQDFAAPLPIDVLKIRLEGTPKTLLPRTTDSPKQLDELSTLEVFEKRCESLALNEDQKAGLRVSFEELLDWMHTQE